MKQEKATFTYGNVINLLIAFESDTWSRDLNTRFTQGDCLFGAVKLNKINMDTRAMVLLLIHFQIFQ